MMHEFEVGKCARGPAQHVSFDFVHSVPAGCVDESADLVPAFTPIDLGGPPDVKCRIDLGLHFQGAVDLAANRSSADAQGRICLEALKALFKIVAGKRQITVEFYQEIPRRDGVVECWGPGVLGAWSGKLVDG